MARHKNLNWNLSDFSDGLDWEQAQVAVLLDIRDALQSIDLKLGHLQPMRNRLDCHETLSIPRLLRRISANTAKKKRRKPARTGVVQ